MDLLLATRNAHKTRELAQLLGSGLKVRDLLSRDNLPLVEETGSTFAENATLKATAVSRHVREIVIADDSGLEVDALNGAPGVFSARYAGAQASDTDNIAKLLHELRGRTPAAGRFRCVLAVARGGTLIRTFEGVVDGQVVERRRGTHGFGYDPVFVPNGFVETFAEMPPRLKNELSHRARAAAQLRNFLSRANAS